MVVSCAIKHCNAAQVRLIALCPSSTFRLFSAARRPDVANRIHVRRQGTGRDQSAPEHHASLPRSPGGRRFSKRESEAALVGSGATAQLSLQEGDGGGQDAQRPEMDVVELYYSSGWHTPTILYSIQGGEWDRIPMHQVASSSGLWKYACFHLNKSGSKPGAPLLEFVFTDTGEKWDKPWAGGNYVINSRGSFILRNGEMQAVTGRGVLVVSDLDDTMIGDDAATSKFKHFWESEAIPRGSRLVYNTGRSLEAFQALMIEKEGILAPPDVLITSVGTRVYNIVDGNMVEDTQYSAKLDEGWNLEVVREAAYASLAAVGRQHMHFRPPEEQNEHKVTCGVALTVLDETLARIQKLLSKGGVQARLTVSGFGDWRFLDIVSIRAGKLEALEFVRVNLGFSHSSTLAAGDSGNDIDMLGGKHLAVVVANAQAELLRWLITEKESRDPKRILAASQQRAAGIIEALETFGFK